MTKENPLLLFDRLSEWMQCFCVVTFDLELGQSMEVVCPGNVQLTEQDKNNICYLAFPDSNSGCLGDTYFHFRAHLSFEAPQAASIDKRKALVRYNLECAPSLQTDRGMHFGYVLFRQIKDRNIPRGYFQKSVVLISKFPFLNVYREILRIVAPEFFDSGPEALELACRDIDRWPSLQGLMANVSDIESVDVYVGLIFLTNFAPLGTAFAIASNTYCLLQVGIPLILPVLKHSLNVTIPSLLDGALPGASYPSNLSGYPSASNIPITSIHDLDFMKTFHGFLSHLHIFWELVLCNEPLAVIAPTPNVCSEIVQGLVWIIWPLKYAADYRPFFTIHDQDFKDYTTKTQAAPRLMLGVTNPFFVKTLQHWPHIMRVGDSEKIKAEDSAKTKTPQKLVNTVDFKQGLYSEYKSYLSKDKALIKRLQKGIQSKRPVEAQSSLIKKYFYELTHSFMIPLERYVSTLMPLLRDIGPFRSPPILRPFDVDEFLETVEIAGPQLTSGIKGDWEGLYVAFLKSENFTHWFEMREREINAKLRLVHLETLASADFEMWASEKSEVELVDVILKTRSRVQAVRADGTKIDPEILSKLRNSLDVVLGKLPPDLRAAIKSGNSNGQLL